MSEQRGFSPRQLLTKENALIAVGALAVAAIGIGGDQARRRVLNPIHQLRAAPTLEEIVSHVSPSERTLGLRPGQVDTLITLGDSTCHPDGDPRSMHESFTHVAANALGIPKERVYNFGTPGIGIPEVREQLKDQTIRNLLLTAKKPVLITSLNGNDWRAMVSKEMRRHLEVLRRIPSPTLRNLLSAAPSVFALALRHSDTASFFQEEYSSYLSELSQLNTQRLQAGMESLRVVITTPPDFAESPGITFVPSDGNKVSVSDEVFDTSEPSVYRIVHVVAATVAERTLHAHRRFKRGNRSLPTAIASLSDVVQMRSDYSIDQHLNPDTHKHVGRLVAHVICPQIG